MKVTIGLKQYILITTGVVLIGLSAPYVVRNEGPWFMDYSYNYEVTMLAVGIGILTGGLLSMFSDAKRKK